MDGFAHRRTQTNSIKAQPKVPILNRNTARILSPMCLILNGRKSPNTGDFPFLLLPQPSPTYLAGRSESPVIGGLTSVLKGAAHRKTKPNSIERQPKAPILNRNTASVPSAKALILNDGILPNIGRFAFHVLRQTSRVYPACRPQSPKAGGLPSALEYRARREVRAGLVLLTRFKFEQNIASRTNASRALKPTARCRVGGLAEGWSSAWNRWTPECNA